MPSSAYSILKTQLENESGNLLECTAEFYCRSNQQCSYLASILKTITLTIDSSPYPIAPDQYLLSDYDGFNCVVAIAEETSSENYFVLGAVFLR